MQGLVLKSTGKIYNIILENDSNCHFLVMNELHYSPEKNYLENINIKKKYKHRFQSELSLRKAKIRPTYRKMYYKYKDFV